MHKTKKKNSLRSTLLSSFFALAVAGVGTGYAENTEAFGACFPGSASPMCQNNQADNNTISQEELTKESFNAQTKQSFDISRAVTGAREAAIGDFQTPYINTSSVSLFGSVRKTVNTVKEMIGDFTYYDPRTGGYKPIFKNSPEIEKKVGKLMGKYQKVLKELELYENRAINIKDNRVRKDLKALNNAIDNSQGQIRNRYINMDPTISNQIQKLRNGRIVSSGATAKRHPFSLNVYAIEMKQAVGGSQVAYVTPNDIVLGAANQAKLDNHLMDAYTQKSAQLDKQYEKILGTSGLGLSDIANGAICQTLGWDCNY